MKRVSIKDIAKKAGVVPSTVSFVLNGKAKEMRISDSLSKKIKAVADEEGYSPNGIAVSLRTGRSKIIGLIVEDISNAFFATLAKIIEDEANALGYKVVYCSTENDSKKGRDLIKMLFKSQVDGFLITPSAGIEKDIENFVSHKVPLVFMDRYLPNLSLSHVIVDNAKGVKDGVEYLLHKGYKKIAFVTVDLQQVQMQERENGFRSIFNDTDFLLDESLILKLPFNFEKDEAIETIKTFITNSKIDAVFFATNYLGILGIECIAQLGLKMPGQLAMMCFDDHDIFRLYPPGITSIQQPVKEIGITSVHLLIDQIHNKKNKPVDSHIQLPVKLIVRGST